MTSSNVTQFCLRRPLMALVVLAGSIVTPGLGQDGGSLSGLIRDLESGAPLEGVQISIVGTRISAETDADGRYRLDGLQPGEYQLRLRRVGYASLVEQAEVRAGTLTIAYFELPPFTGILEELRVTAKAEHDVEPDVGRTVSDALDRTPGVQVIRGSGQAGSGTRVLIRGRRSLSLRSDPLVYVDGIRVNYLTAGQAGVAGLSVLDLFSPSTVESIEVLHGAEASRYGLGSGNGVILITTKRSGDVRKN